MTALENGVAWVDSTVTGMGRGPGNTKTESLCIEIVALRGQTPNVITLLEVVREYFLPLKAHFGWGTNVFYYLGGVYGIHPTYIQEMLNDARYSDDDILAVLDYLREIGGNKFDPDMLDIARHFYHDVSHGTWDPKTLLANKDILVLGSGPGVSEHRATLKSYIRTKNPIVIALNTRSEVDEELIDVRIACHPVRLLADCENYSEHPQPLITPFGLLPEEIKLALKDTKVFDYGLEILPDTFEFRDFSCVVPKPLVIAYTLALASSGDAHRVLLAGFDGYNTEDPRNLEMHNILTRYLESDSGIELLSVTPTRYPVSTKSIYSKF